MRVYEVCAFVTISLLIVCGSAIASERHEHRIASGAPKQLSRYISLVCNNGNVSFSIHWNTRIGRPGKYRRHLILPGNLGDTHILLKVLPDQKSTGIIDNDKQAKALIKLILENVTAESMFIEVFPEGRDPVTGEWENSAFEYKEFLKAVNAVSKECNWNIKKPIKANVSTVKPGEPYDDE